MLFKCVFNVDLDICKLKINNKEGKKEKTVVMIVRRIGLINLALSLFTCSA